MCVAKNDIVETGEANLSIHVGWNRYDAFPFYKRFVVLFRDVSASSSNCDFHPMFKANILFLHAFNLCLKSLIFFTQKVIRVHSVLKYPFSRMIHLHNSCLRYHQYGVF